MLGRRASHLGPAILLAIVLAVALAPRAGGAPPGGDPAAAPPPRPAPVPGAGLRWPLEIPGTLLSSFGEYRYDHLHAGIDISTGGGTGYKVHASADGVIYRVKVEWRGYGRAVYVRHRNGRITVYGHLERFEDRVLGLERRVARRQTEMKTRYPGDLYFDAPLPVRRGQVIAFSGESGVGLPHLHFEVRDGEDHPVDPFLAGLPVPADHRPPILGSLLVTAGRADVFIEGNIRQRAYRLVHRGGALVSEEPVRVSGPFLLALTAHDPAGTDGRAGVHGIELRIDGRTAYAITFEGFRFAQYPQAGLLYDHRGSRLGPAAFAYRLFTLPGNELARPIDRGNESAAPPDGRWTYPGALSLDSGPHTLEITARDEAGNRARARVSVVVAPAGAAPSAETVFDADRRPVLRVAPGLAASGTGSSPARFEAEIWSGAGDRFLSGVCDAGRGLCTPPPGAGGSTVWRLRSIEAGVPGPWRIIAPPGEPRASYDAGDLRLEAWPAFLDLLVPVDRPFAPAAAVEGRGGGVLALSPLQYRDGLRYGAPLDYREVAAAQPLTLQAPGAPGAGRIIDADVRFLKPGEPLRYSGPGFTLEMPAAARYYEGPVCLRTEQAPGDPGLPAMADVVEVLPGGEALREPATLSFAIDPRAVDPAALGIYRWEENRGRWAYEGGDAAPDGSSIAVRFRRYGRFALLQDASPPVLTAVRPAAGAVIASRRPSITADVDEQGEGLEFDGVTFLLDDAALESEFDPDRGRARVLEPPALAPGTHRLRVQAVDRAGNPAEPIEVTFQVR